MRKSYFIHNAFVIRFVAVEQFRFLARVFWKKKNENIATEIMLVSEVAMSLGEKSEFETSTSKFYESF